MKYKEDKFPQQKSKSHCEKVLKVEKDNQSEKKERQKDKKKERKKERKKESRN